ncbi:MAG TPA: hypothetical protein EYG34_08125 [Acidimicrobiia bacterium]|jgi:Uncharacterized conserved protein|nr:hypothetical protein [Acidimicrobiia bacterium]HIL47064.1 hypothetical protein [Acidimicrobiia bacterium]
MIDGQGNPNTSDSYLAAITTLYPLAYGFRKEIKDTTGTAYTVLPLEALWWADNMNAFVESDHDQWKWTLMICLPQEATAQMAAQLIPAINNKKQLPAGHKVRFEFFGDGPAAQILHQGPYHEEGPTIARLHDFIAEQGLERTGLHHEIYLSDPRRVAPEKIRTILRQPVNKP